MAEPPVPPAAPSPRRSGGALLPWLWLLAALGLYTVLVPPFLNPDEVQHFCVVLDGIYPATEHPRLERELIGLLRQSDWLRRVGADPSPGAVDSLAQVPALAGYPLTGARRAATLYHRLLAVALRPLRGVPLVRLFLLTRICSLLLVLAAFALLGWTLAREFPPLRRIGLPLLLAFPQVLLLAGAVNYDGLLTLCGTLFFAAVLRLAAGGSRWWLAGLLAGTVGAVLTKRAGWLLFAFLFLLPPLLRRRGGWLRAFSFLALGGIAFVWLTWLFPATFAPRISALFASLAVMTDPSVAGVPMTWSAYFAFLGKSFVYCFGGIWHFLPGGWYLLYGAIFAAVLLGCLRACRDPATCRRVVFFVFTLIAQVAAIWLFYGRIGHYAQGRYFFPWLLPICYLLGLGLGRLPAPGRNRLRLFDSLFLLQVTVNAYALLFLIPSFAYLARLPVAGGV